MTAPARPLTRRRLLELFGIAMAIIAIWIIAGLFTASDFYRRSLAVGGWKDDIVSVLRFQMAQSMNWALFTPVIIFIAERLPLRKPVWIRNALLLIALLPVIAVVRAAWGGIVLNLAEGQRVFMPMIRLSIKIRTHRNIAIGALIVVITNLVMAQREAAARARRELAVQTLLARAELDELRAQIQPHFLFKTLHTIAEVVHVDPAAADDMIVRLADLLRRGLALGHDPVSLSDELDFVDRNLALYRICFGGRLDVRFEAGEDVLAARVPPLLVQQLVENAVVNAIAPFGGGEIEIRCRRAGDQLRIEVRDSSTSASRDDDHGLTPVRARLEKLFGTAQMLTIHHDAAGVITSVVMPIEISSLETA